MESESSQNSCDPDIDNDPNEFYMYGDTRTLILDGLRETRHENLGKIIHHCITNIGIPLHPTDIEEVIRIGKYSPNRKLPRPVKVTFREQVDMFVQLNFCAITLKRHFHATNLLRR